MFGKLNDTTRSDNVAKCAAAHDTRTREGCAAAWRVRRVA